MNPKIAQLSNLLLAIPFIYAIIYPQANITFIKDTGVMLFIAEFISIFLSAFAATKRSLKDQVVLFLIFFVILLRLASDTRSPFIFYFLIISFFTKLFIFKKSESSVAFAKPVLVLILMSTFVSLTQGIWQMLIPLPDAVVSQTSKAVFARTPQVLLVWGVIYPIGLYLTSFVKINAVKTK